MKKKKKIELSYHQNLKWEALLNSRERIVQLKGAAGVGKSFVIAKFIHTTHDKVVLCGTTHRAVANLSEIGHGIAEAMTIHSYLGFKPVSELGAEPHLEQIADHKIKPCDYLIVDESSMLNSELLEAIEENIANGTINRKAILVGDPIQLIIDKTLNLDIYPSFELTEQMRQNGCPFLSETLQKLRDAIDSNGAVFKIEGDGVDIIRTENHAEFLHNYAIADGSKILLAYTNDDVKTYNLNIVKYLLKKDDEYNIGDVVFPTSSVIDKDGKNVIKNRERCVISQIFELDEHYEIFVDGNRMIKVAKDQKWFKKTLQEHAKNSRWGAFYSMKNQYAIIHHAYASTIHSAQGMSVDKVFIDMSSFLSLKHSDGQELLRMIYVALSRAKISATVFVGRSRNFESLINAFKD